MRVRGGFRVVKKVGAGRGGRLWRGRMEREGGRER